ncbi:MAG: NAD(P)/FAD-dependent oxidoreductase [Lachnospiraceae bacterium]|nr:NAD(P)/FAD-dependent oxidoreductase [Lachnospiraceae bacterium]
MSNVVVIGGGAAGMMASYSAGMCGHNVLLLEKNEKLGKKIYITGKGRCNFTNACDISDFFKNIVTNEKFLYSSLYTFSPDQMMEFIKQHGTPIKVERGNRAFPVSDHASDITKALSAAMKEVGVKVRLNTAVTKILVENQKVVGVKLKNNETIVCDHVILASGGNSYQSTGSNGDGYGFARNLNLKVCDIAPALVPLETKEDDILSLQGLSLKNVSLKVCDEKKTYYDDFGEMLFTHFGISGPLVLSASSYVTKVLKKKDLKAYIDLKPALTYDKLEQRILRLIKDNPKKGILFLLKDMLPGKLAEVCSNRLDISLEKHLCDITKEERNQIILMLKGFELTITNTRGFKEAIVTQGGIDVKELNPSTMEVKSIKGLSICGEVLDVDALTGGFNLQIAFSTGYLAGISIE